jgi:hypothetical protein
MSRWYRRNIDPDGRVTIQAVGSVAELVSLPDTRAVAVDRVGGRVVSTVFLGLDLRHGEGAPVLWETMVFGDDGADLGCLRYTSEADALSGHAAALAWARGEGAWDGEYAPDGETE